VRVQLVGLALLSHDWLHRDDLVAKWWGCNSLRWDRYLLPETSVQACGCRNVELDR
jgi:hypothetical protein